MKHIKVHTNEKHYSRGFTLAETLLTLAIIGVVMALMLRALSRVNPDKDKVLFIKSYHAVEAVLADIMNDGTKYDQNYYSPQQLNLMTAEEKANLRMDLSTKPMDTAKASYTDENGKVKTVCKSGCDQTFTQANALCYFLADSLNTVGNVDCTAGNKMNFKTSNGVCFWGWIDSGSDGNMGAVIDPNCTGIDTGYEVYVFKDGKMTVPETAKTYTQLNTNGNQTRAYQWMLDQTQVK